MKRDAVNNTVISEEDTMIEELMDLDQDMDFGDIQYQPEKDLGPMVVYQKDKFGTDEATMASFSTRQSQESQQSKRTKRLRSNQSIESGSTTSTLTVTTKATLESRISKMEVSNKKIEHLLVNLVQQLQPSNNTTAHRNQTTQDTNLQGTHSEANPTGKDINSEAETPERASADE